MLPSGAHCHDPAYEYAGWKTESYVLARVLPVILLEILNCREQQVYLWHEKAHSGVALNELADGWAKLAVKGMTTPPPDDMVG